MSLLIELIKTIAEAIEESRTGQRSPQAAGPPTRPAPQQQQPGSIVLEDVPESLAPPPSDAARAQRRLAEKHEELQRERELLAARAARVAAAAAARPVAPPPRQHLGGERIARLLHQPNTVRDLLVLKEVLDRPLAMRQRHR